MRVSEGIARRKAEGKPVGRVKDSAIETKKAKQAKQDIMKHSKDLNGSLNDLDCRKLIGISRNSFYKSKRQLKENVQR